jgi:hypothetical protein
VIRTNHGSISLYQRPPDRPRPPRRVRYTEPFRHPHPHLPIFLRDAHLDSLLAIDWRHRLFRRLPHGIVTGIQISDIWHFGTLQKRGVDDLRRGTMIEATELAFVEAIG